MQHSSARITLQSAQASKFTQRYKHAERSLSWIFILFPKASLVGRRHTLWNKSSRMCVRTIVDKSKGCLRRLGRIILLSQLVRLVYELVALENYHFNNMHECFGFCLPEYGVSACISDDAVNPNHNAVKINSRNRSNNNKSFSKVKIRRINGNKLKVYWMDKSIFALCRHIALDMRCTARIIDRPSPLPMKIDCALRFTRANHCHNKAQ